jgi:thiamine-phosphate pyrophosphorylase
MSRLIIITHPGSVFGEISICKKLLAEGLERLHVRKPNWNDAKIAQWLDHFSKEELKKMVIHHNYMLFDKFPLGGLHVSYSPLLPDVNKGTLSCSVHSWEEATEAFVKCDYAFISPLFDSISKNAYKKNPKLTYIPSHLAGKKIVALGGIDNSNVTEVFDLGYYGAALLGYIWNNPDKAIDNFTQLNTLIHV